MAELTFDLSQPNQRRATPAMMQLARRLVASTPGLTAPPTADFDDVRQWIDDVIGSEPTPASLSQDQYLTPGWSDDLGSAMVDTTQFEIPGLGC